MTAPTNTRRPTAMIADDEPLLRESLARLLAQTWPELDVIAQVRNGRTAVESFEAQHPDICFLDVHMPGLSGIEAARFIGRRAHVVFVTAYDQYAVQAFDQGALDYLVKPVELARLMDTVARLKERLRAAPEKPDTGALLDQIAARVFKQAPPASLLAVARGEPPVSAPAVVEPDLAAELAAQLMSEPMLAPAPVAPAPTAAATAADLALDQSIDLAFSEPAAAPPAPVVVEPVVAVAADAAAPTAAELEDSVFDRVTPVPPIDHDEIAIAPSEPPRRITAPMGSPRSTSTTAPPPVDYATDDIELAPRSGVGLGHDAGEA